MTNQRKRHPWPHDEIASDFEYAIGVHGSADVRWVGIGSDRTENVTPYEVLKVERWHVSYHSGPKWVPGMETGTELALYAVLRLRGGLWASVEAGNDYTGWGCQEHADVRIGISQDDVVRHGLSQSGRLALGYEVVER